MNTKKSEEKQFSNPELMQALYWIWDAFDRSLMACFVIYDTAQSMIDHKQLEGNAIYMGVRKNEWIAGARSVFYAFSGDPVEKNKEYEKFIGPLNDVPVYVYIFEDHPCIISTNQVLYEHEYFMLPNPYSQFIKLYPWKFQ